MPLSPGVAKSVAAQQLSTGSSSSAPGSIRRPSKPCPDSPAPGETLHILGIELPLFALAWPCVACGWYSEIPSSTTVPQCTHFDVVVPIDGTSSPVHCHYSLKTRLSTDNLNTLATSFSLWPTLASNLKAEVTDLGTVIPWPYVRAHFSDHAPPS